MKPKFLATLAVLVTLFLMSTLSFAAEPLKNVIIDTDVGVDDAIAIFYLLNQPNVNVLAITIAADGNAHCAPAYYNIKQILQIMHQTHIPVACGPAKPLQGTHQFPEAILTESDTLAGMFPKHPHIVVPALSAVDLMINTISSAKSPVIIVAIGPLTNIALALQKNPDIANKISRIYQMGGAVRVKGNVHEVSPELANTTAEWNIYIDPVASEQVFRSGIRINLVPLDVTNTVLINRDFYQKLRAHHESPAAAWVYKLLRKNPYMFQKNDWYFWDPMAAVIALHPELGTIEKLPLSVPETPETQSGATLIDTKNGSEIEVTTKIQGDIFKKTLLKGLGSKISF